MTMPRLLMHVVIRVLIVAILVKLAACGATRPAISPVHRAGLFDNDGPPCATDAECFALCVQHGRSRTTCATLARR